VLSSEEIEEVQQTLKKSFLSKCHSTYSQLKDFKNQQGAFTVDAMAGEETIWDSVDDKPAWKFWDDVPITERTSCARHSGI
jgi:hypothetical protein